MCGRQGRRLWLLACPANSIWGAQGHLRTEAMKHNNVPLGKNCCLNFNPASLASVTPACLNNRVGTSVSRMRPGNSVNHPIVLPAHTVVLQRLFSAPENQNCKHGFLLTQWLRELKL